MNHTLVPCGDQLSLSQKAKVARLQTELSNVFSPLPGRTDLIEHHIKTPPGVVVSECRPDGSLQISLSTLTPPICIISRSAN
ncbi:hypothetical protein SRHO_G00188210 [Serrasalmus rhombeus]